MAIRSAGGDDLATIKGASEEAINELIETIDWPRISREKFKAAWKALKTAELKMVYQHKGAFRDPSTMLPVASPPPSPTPTAPPWH